MIDLLNIDCMEYMATQPDKAFDLAIVDPPYGIGVAKMNIGNRAEVNRCTDGKEWDSNIPTGDYFNELIRVSVDQIIWGANYMNCFSGNNGAIVWDKDNPLPTSSRCEIASYSKHSRVAYYKQTWTNYVNDKSSNHPTEKPTNLYKWLLTNYAKPGQRILDTHLGSGSSAIAAHYFGCDFVGCEIDPDYYQAACERFDRETRQASFL